MSRLAFREPVASPRPDSAVGMVALATASLALTGQVALPVLGMAGVAIALAAWRCRTPCAAWQQRALVLDSALAAAVLAGVWIYWQGALAMVALAHFVVLVQGLQLLDARPRRSEFLLVALSLFQVILAANLTAGPWFPLVLTAFTASAVWTLLVHTLRAEAIEAGAPAAAQAALSAAGLRRTTLWAFFATLLLAVLLFPTLPRIRSGSLLSRGPGATQAVSGFSDEVALGDLGRIRMDPSLVLRVETVEGEPGGPEQRYWRGLAFDHFDGRRWSARPNARRRLHGDPEIGVGFEVEPVGRRLVQRITREPVASGVLFAAGRPSGLRGPVGKLERDVHGNLYAHRSADHRVEYRVASRVVAPRDDVALARDRAAPPPAGGARHLQLPELAPELHALARRITEDAGSDAERAARLERYLLETGRYSDTPPRLAPGDSRSPLERFLLGGVQGHCEYFASSMVMLARSVGLPARLVNGFAGGHPNAMGDFIELSQSDAHTWVEVHYAGAGWVRYDPTPADLRLAGADALRGSRSFGELLSALELWWFRNVVDFDRGHQAQAVRSLWRRWARWRGDPGGPFETAASERDRAPGSVPGASPWGLAAALLVLTSLLVAADLRRRARRPEAMPRFYAQALRMLGRRGLERPPSMTAREFAREAGCTLPPTAARVFASLTETYLRARFGGGASSPHGRRELAALREALARGRNPG